MTSPWYWLCRLIWTAGPAWLDQSMRRDMRKTTAPLRIQPVTLPSFLTNGRGCQAGAMVAMRRLGHVQI